jgi:hypothetical protein
MREISNQKLREIANHLIDYGHLIEDTLGFVPARYYNQNDFVGVRSELSEVGLNKTRDLISKYELLREVYGTK